MSEWWQTSEYQNSGVTGVTDKRYSLNTSRYYLFRQLCNFFFLERERQSWKTKPFFNLIYFHSLHFRAVSE